MGDVQTVLTLLGLDDGGDASTLLPVQGETLRAFCEKWGVATLEVFGSTATGSGDAGSDIDILVGFLDGRLPGLFDMTRMEEELEALLGREVDLVDREAVERSENPYRRGSILRSAIPVYSAPK